MKKGFFIFIMATTLLSGTIFIGCKSPAQKVEDAQTGVKDAKEDLRDAKTEANAQADLDASNEEWRTFKRESELQIKDNEARIAELKTKMKESGKKVDAAYEKSIEAIEEKSKNVKNKMETYAYDNNLNNWDAFKREFNRDMDELGKAFKDLVDNSNK
jgi:exonuclease VII large subunit